MSQKFQATATTRSASSARDRCTALRCTVTAPSRSSGDCAPRLLRPNSPQTQRTGRAPVASAGRLAWPACLPACARQAGCRRERPGLEAYRPPAAGRAADWAAGGWSSALNGGGTQGSAAAADRRGRHGLLVRCWTARHVAQVSGRVHGRWSGSLRSVLFVAVPQSSTGAVGLLLRLDGVPPSREEQGGRRGGGELGLWGAKKR